MQHGPNIGPNMTQDEHSQAPKFWVAKIYPIQNPKAIHTTTQIWKRCSKVQLPSCRFLSFNFRKFPPQTHPKHLEVKLPTYRLETFNIKINNTTKTQTQHNTTHKEHGAALTWTTGQQGPVLKQVLGGTTGQWCLPGFEVLTIQWGHKAQRQRGNHNGVNMG